MKTNAIGWISLTIGLICIGLIAEVSQAVEVPDNPEAAESDALDAVVNPPELLEPIDSVQLVSSPEPPESESPADLAVRSTLPPIDPLEQLSTDEWLDLLSDKPTDNPTEPSPTSHPISQSAADLSGDLSMPQARLLPPPAPSLTPSLTEAAFVSNETQSSPLSASPPPSSKSPRIGNLGGQPPLVAQNSAAIHTWASQSPALAETPATSATSDSPSWLKNSMAQVTSVSQLSDVQPTDWAYQALQSLTERYGAIQGYPDGLFRGNRSLTRFEFAAGLNAALDRVSELIASSSQNAATKADLATINRLQDDFRDELITLRARLDGLDARVAEVTANQFSTTVVLNGQTTFGIADAWGGNPPGRSQGNPVFAYLSQLQLSGSFSQHDAFRIDLEAGNFDGGGFANPDVLNTQMALLGFQTDTNNQIELSGVEYRVALGDRLVFTAKPVGFSLDTVLSPNSLYTSASQGALSRFAAENPVFRIGDLDSGLGLDWLITDRARLQIAYGARDAGNPTQGLFESDHRAFGVQLLTRPFGAFTTGIAYVNAFASDGFLDTFTGSTNADTSGGFQEAAAIHAVSGTFQWPITSHIVLGAWGGLTVTDSLPSDAVAVSSTYQFSLGFPDTFGREGDLLGIMVGQPFRLRYGLQVEREDEASGLHYEIFYRIRVNDNIAITPGIFIVTDPGHIANNNTIIVGAIRSSFEF